VEVRVEVTDADGKPVKGAFVTATRDREFAGSARTDSKGIATLRLLPGTYDMAAARPVTPTGGGPITMTSEAPRKIHVQPGGPQRISFRLK
jgi:protocatechuate 3,4-dioxygenase beta subunit